MNEAEELKVQERQQVILEHLSGRLNATQAAQALGVSRKTFYAWLKRARAALRAALRDRPGGRPMKPADPEKDQLQATVETLEKERLVLEGRLRIQEAIRETLAHMQQAESPPKKKEREM